MTTDALQEAIATTRTVLANVQPDQRSLPTPCAKWDVAELINHIVGGQVFFANGASGQKGDDTEVDYASGDFLAAYDEAAAAAVAAFDADGVLDSTLTLPFGEMPGTAFLGMAVTDTLAHGWDLAKATGQSTDLAPELAAGVLAQSQGTVPDGFRSEEGNIFGLEQTAPAGATAADQLAAFLGRTV